MNHRKVVLVLINTLLFDLDGTLINTNELIIASFTHTFNHYQVKSHSREDIIGFIGEPLEDSFAKVNPDLVEAMVRTYREHNIAHHDELVMEYPNVYETIKSLHEQGYKLGVVTSKARTTVKMGLKLTKLDAFFDVVVTIDDVKKPKPDAEPVLMALAQLQSKPDESIMVGDSIFDIRSGKNAAVTTAAVGWTIKGREALEKESPDYILDDMGDLLNIVGVPSR